MATCIDTAPFLAAIAVQVSSIPVQARVAANLKDFHRKKQTAGASLSSTPEDIARRFIVDSDYIASVAAGVAFVASAVLVVVSGDKFDPRDVIIYILLGVVFLGACFLIYRHYREAYGLYRKCSFLRKKISPATLAVLVINLLGIAAILFLPST